MLIFKSDQNWIIFYSIHHSLKVLKVALNCVKKKNKKKLKNFVVKSAYPAV